MSSVAEKKQGSKELITFIDNELVARADRMNALLHGTGINAEKFRYQATQQLIRKPDLMPYVQENPGSFISSVMEAAEQGLDFALPNEAHLVPIPGNSDKGRKGSIALFRGYKGWAKLARKNPRVKDLDAHPIHKNDKYERILGSNPELIHTPPSFGEERGEIIGFYAIAYLANGMTKWVEMTTKEAEKHARRFIKAKFGPFSGVKSNGKNDDNFEAYGLKTVTIRLCARKLDLGAQFAQAMRSELEAEGIESEAFESDVIDAEIVDLTDKVAERKAALKKQAEEVKTGAVSEDEIAADEAALAGDGPQSDMVFELEN